MDSGHGTIGDRVGEEDDLYGRYFVGESFFVTCTVVGREPIFREAATVHLLRSVLNRLRLALGFHGYGYVFMADHVHLLMRSDDPSRAERIVAEIEAQFTHDYQQMMGIPGKMAVWQPGYDRRRVGDVGTFAACLDYIHYNPVYHKVTARPEEWPHSSYPHWVERRLYKLGWGWTLPDRLAGIHWE